MFSTKNQNRNLFDSLTPKNFIITSNVENQQRSTFEKLIKRQSSGIEIEPDSKMDEIVDNLKSEIKKNQIFSETFGGNKKTEDNGLNLDIGLINDTYLTDRLNKPSHIQTPLSKTKDQISCRRFGEWICSPNSSFLLRKKMQNS